jgi:pyruvate dehydrogenase E2 component (dihydrolipoamide acetyltransferase)
MSEILMPRLSDTMEEGVISTWHKKPGDKVAAGDALVDIETDKALMEYEAYEEGVLGEILVPEGGTASIGTPIATLVTDGSASDAVPAPRPPAEPTAQPEPSATGEGPATGGGTAAGGSPAADGQSPAEAGQSSAEGGRSPSRPGGHPTSIVQRDAQPAEGVGTAVDDGSRLLPGHVGNGRSRPPSSPLARRIARESGVDLTTVTGSGPGGRIVRADVEAAARHAAVMATQPGAQPGVQAAPQAAPQATATPSAAQPVPQAAGAVREADPDTEQVPLSRIRKVTARRLAESMRTAPHFYLTRVVDAGELLAFRATLNAALAPAKVSVNDLIVKACATALRANPVLNVSFTEEHLLVHKRVHVGVAVALEEGLVVPVIRDADRKSVSAIGAETRELAGRAREQKLTPQEMSGGTFTVSNLGMFGVDAFTAVINPPEAAILAVGATRKEVVFRDGEVVPRDRMTLTLSIDHRACDGATGARFLGELVDLLENPLRIVA